MTPTTTSTEPMLQPTHVGYISTTEDKLLLVEACLSGKLHHIPRFLRHSELKHVMRSGNIFVYEENATASGDWDDGKEWVLVAHEHGLRIDRVPSTTGTLMKKSGDIVVRGGLSSSGLLLQCGGHAQWHLDNAFSEPQSSGNTSSS